MLPNIHILGIQGSGKGTQSELLVEKYKLTYVPSGNLFRARAAKGDDFGNELSNELQGGRLLPTAYLVRTVEDFLDTSGVERGLLGDGVIRTIEQYTGLEPVWEKHQLGEPFLVHLVLSEEVAMQRIQQRLNEQNDPKKYSHHLVYSGKLLKRNDDNPKAIQERFALFHLMTQPVINHFERNNRCIHIDATADVQTIYQEICQALERHFPSLRHVTD